MPTAEKGSMMQSKAAIKKSIGAIPQATNEFLYHLHSMLFHTFCGLIYHCYPAYSGPRFYHAWWMNSDENQYHLLLQNLYM